MSRGIDMVACTAAVLAALCACSAVAVAGQAAVPNPNAGLIRHTVFFRYTNVTTAAEKQEVFNRYTALYNLCVRPTDGQPYIVSFEYGLNNSREGLDRDFEHGFIVTFNNIEDRNYFVGRPFQTDSYDPHHDAFKAFVGPYLRLPIATGLVVMDFSVAPMNGAVFPPYNMQPNTSVNGIARSISYSAVQPLGTQQAVRHVIGLRFNAQASIDFKQSFALNYTSFLYRCVRPGTNTPYIVSFDGGLPNSKEGFDNNFDQVYTLLFNSTADRDYFSNSDPLHQELKRILFPYLYQPLSEGIFVFDFVELPTLSGVSPYASMNPAAGLVRHVVTFRYNELVTSDIRNEIINRYLSLYNLCTRPTDNTLYIVSFDAGFNSSKEGADSHMQDGFIVTFSSVDDRNYFVGRPFQTSYDPNHDAFKAFVGPYLLTPVVPDGLVVMDFSVSPVLGMYALPPYSTPSSVVDRTLMRANTVQTANDNAGLVRHVVTFRFSDATPWSVRTNVTLEYTSLLKKCVRPVSQTPYIVSFDGGRNNSKEGADRLQEQLYIVTFSSEEDRNYFVGRPFQQNYDPYHDAFKAYVGPYLRVPVVPDGLFVFDFTVEADPYPVPTPADRPSDHPNWGLVAGLAVTAGVLIAVLIVCQCVRRRNNARHVSSSEAEAAGYNAMKV